MTCFWDGILNGLQRRFKLDILNKNKEDSIHFKKK